MSGITLVSPERFTHGTRARYVAGKCRCDDCRRANREYAASRVGAEPNGLVNTDEARSHLMLLARCGIGTRTVADVAQCGRSVVKRIMAGEKVRASIVRRVLAIDAGAASDGAYVPAAKAWSAIGQLLRLGLTRGEIAQGIGRKTPALQLRRGRITRRNEGAIFKLLDEVRTQGAVDICTSCGESHEPARRIEWLSRVDISDRDAIQDARSCWYPLTEAGARKLARDLAVVRAREAA